MQKIGGEPMEISKKDLLKETGISYGQLYRWKREGLIPEEWFIKRSAFTGQETFFPRDKVLPRIQAILELKESYSLEEMAKMFAEPAPATTVSPQEDEPTIPCPSVAKIPLTDLPPKVKMIVDELSADGINLQAKVLLCGLAKLIAPLTLTLSETKGLIGSALAIRVDEIGSYTLTLWSGDRPHYFITLHKNNPIIMDNRFEKVDEIDLRSFSSDQSSN